MLQPTKVTMLNYEDICVTEWAESSAFHKLRAVLFVPIVKFDESRPDQWFIRRPFLWLPSVAILDQLKEDYDSYHASCWQRHLTKISSAKPPKGQGVFMHPNRSGGERSVPETIFT